MRRQQVAQGLSVECLETGSPATELLRERHGLARTNDGEFKVMLFYLGGNSGEHEFVVVYVFFSFGNGKCLVQGKSDDKLSFN